MKSTHEPDIEKPKISLIAEAKIVYKKARIITVKKTTKKYVDELWLKFLKESEVIEGFKVTRAGGETEIELYFLDEDAR